MARLIWSPAAAQELEAIGDYVARDKPDAALNLVRRLFAGVEALSRMPQRGRPGRIDGTRELVVAPYIVVYEVQVSRVLVLHIYHAARDWPIRARD